MAHLRPAGLRKRGFAAFIDLSVLGCGGLILLFPVIYVLGYLCFFGGYCHGEAQDRIQEVVGYLALLIVPCAYFLFSWSRPGGGQTPGMRASGIRLIRSDGEVAGLGQAALRLAVVLVLVVPAGFWEFLGLTWLGVLLAPFQLFGFIALIASIVLRRDRRGFHDLIAGTSMVDRGKA